MTAVKLNFPPPPHAKPEKEKKYQVHNRHLRRFYFSPEWVIDQKWVSIGEKKEKKSIFNYSSSIGHIVFNNRFRKRKGGELKCPPPPPKAHHPRFFLSSIYEIMLPHLLNQKGKKKENIVQKRKIPFGVLERHIEIFSHFFFFFFRRKIVYGIE